MKKEVIIILSIFIILLGIFFTSSQVEKFEIKSNGKIRVVIEIKEPKEEQTNKEQLKKEKEKIRERIITKLKKEDVKHIFDKRIALEISEKELDILKSDPDILSIIPDKPIFAFLQDSVPLINATKTWQLQFSGINLTGLTETVCIVDTGIDFSHPDLTGKNLTCNIDCIGKPCVENCSITDDSGHGTHVAGIVSAFGNIKGVAIETKLIGIKVLDSTGSGYGSDLEAGINWCIQNSNNYNISVISMSLGTRCKYSNGSETGLCYNTYCDDVPSEESLALLINNATSRNISVIIAAGNDGNFTHISSPACVKNATSVGATTKNDGIASYSNRNNMTDLFAPGSSINSTMILNPGGSILSSCGTGNSYCVLSGTSMSTPHVAGAFTIIRQFFKLQNNRPPTFLEIQNVLNSTGKIIYDSQSGLNFSRIDVYNAILSLDSTPPNVTLLYPLNNTKNSTLNQDFSCSASDFQLSNITLYIWNSTSLVYNETKNISGTNNNSFFNVNLNYDDYLWNCKSYDLNRYSSFSTNNFTLQLISLNVELISPSNNFFTNQNQTYNCSFMSEQNKSLENSTLYIWNSTSLVYNETKNISGFINSTFFSYNFTSEGDYIWNCMIFNNNSESTFSEQNFTIRYDVTSPLLNFLSSSTTMSKAEINWSTNEQTNFSMLYGTDMDNLTLNLINSTFSFNHSFLLEGLTSSTAYYYNLTYCDRAGNCVTNGTNSFTTLSSTSNTYGSSGGFSFTSLSKNAFIDYYVRDKELSEGLTKEINKNNKIIFNISLKNLEDIIFKLTLKSIGDNYATLMIDSTSLTFFVGESKKLNLTSSDYYDLYIKLEEIINDKVKITIKKIYEPIFSPNVSENLYLEKNKTDYSSKNIEITKKQNLNVLLIYIIILISTILIIFTRFKKTKKKKREKAIKEYRYIFHRHIGQKRIKKKNETTKALSSREKKISFN